jgi:hypothetical protein
MTLAYGSAKKKNIYLKKWYKQAFIFNEELFGENKLECGMCAHVENEMKQKWVLMLNHSMPNVSLSHYSPIKKKRGFK